MYLIHESTAKNFDGIIDVHIQIVNDKEEKKPYIYHIKNEWAVNKFLFNYHRGKKFHGIALSFLTNFKIKEEKRENGL